MFRLMKRLRIDWIGSSFSACFGDKILFAKSRVGSSIIAIFVQHSNLSEKPYNDIEAVNVLCKLNRYFSTKIVRSLTLLHGAHIGLCLTTRYTYTDSLFNHSLHISTLHSNINIFIDLSDAMDAPLHVVAKGYGLCLFHRIATDHDLIFKVTPAVKRRIC
jgi:hypothetical protein